MGLQIFENDDVKIAFLEETHNNKKFTYLEDFEEPQYLIGHSLVKASFFLTAGNVLKIYSTKKIKSVVGLLQVDEKTGWLWIASLVGIVALPPSLLFVSEFMIIKDMFLQHKIALCIVFLLLLTIILYGLTKAVIKMCFSPAADDKYQEWVNEAKKMDWTMYLPQIVMLIIVFYLGLLMPEPIVNLINGTVLGVK